MNYAIKILNDEAQMIHKCLSEAEWKEYPEARKRQLKKLKEIENALNKLNDNQTKLKF